MKMLRNALLGISSNSLKSLLSLLVLISIPVTGFSQDHENWSYNLNIYEVNTRQYTSSGTFSEFATHLDRLKDMGVGILYFMPIHPIGAQNRLGSLGSPYSVKDYLGVNSEFGTIDEFVALVDTIHAKGMYVIMDWVANHTAWDNPLTITNPGWYITDNNGNFIPPPGTNWSDVIQLDYSQQGLRDYMIQAMSFWINEADVDGFRCDAVSFMPLDFWSTAIADLKAIKPEILMLAEDDGLQYQSIGFDMSYGWGLHGFGNGVLKRIANGTSNVAELDMYISNELDDYATNHYRMYFTSNHDENAWHGTVFEQFGAAAEVFAVLTATINSMQLIYGGQEAGLDHRLLFFDKDEIVWQQHPFADLYGTLFHVKKENQALWNGTNGGLLQRVNTTNDQSIFAFVRESENDKLFAIFNLSPGYNGAILTDTLFYGTYTDVFTHDTVTFAQVTEVTYPGWDYNVYEQMNTTAGIQSDDELVGEFHLAQNYPNPFNPVTSIQYKLPQRSDVQITIFDLNGREVTTLVSEIQDAGYKSVQWDASGIASGMYFYQIRAGEFVQTRKMLVLK